MVVWRVRDTTIQVLPGKRGKWGCLEDFIAKKVPASSWKVNRRSLGESRC